jgi:hypothetical protein
LELTPMRLAFFVLLILLIAQIGFWHTLGAVLGAVLMFVILIPLILLVVVIGGVALIAGIR